MEKSFETLEELLEFFKSTPKLDRQKSNYVRLTQTDGVLPEVNYLKSFKLIDEKVEGNSQIIIEITPKWIAIKIHDKSEKYARTYEYPLEQTRGYDYPSIISIIKRIFQN